MNFCYIYIYMNFCCMNFCYIYIYIYMNFCYIYIYIWYISEIPYSEYYLNIVYITYVCMCMYVYVCVHTHTHTHICSVQTSRAWHVHWSPPRPLKRDASRSASICECGRAGPQCETCEGPLIYMYIYMYVCVYIYKYIMYYYTDGHCERHAKGLYIYIYTHTHIYINTLCIIILSYTCYTDRPLWGTCEGPL